MKRSTERYQKHLECFGQDATEFSADTIDQRAVDIAETIDTLSPREQVVCRGLADGLSHARIAKQLHCSWHTVERIIRDLRQHFEELGLKGWMEE